MKKITLEAIQTFLENDDSVTKEQAASILRCCRQSEPRRRLINAREAMRILDISRPTLREYVKHGSLQQINFSSRKVRFDADEVQQLRDQGIVA